MVNSIHMFNGARVVGVNAQANGQKGVHFIQWWVGVRVDKYLTLPGNACCNNCLELENPCSCNSPTNPGSVPHVNLNEAVCPHWYPLTK